MSENDNKVVDVEFALPLEDQPNEEKHDNPAQQEKDGQRDVGSSASLHSGTEENYMLLQTGWKKPLENASLISLLNFHSSVGYDVNAPWYMKVFSFWGTGLVVGVGYMDPGNWATSVAGGSAFGYDLMFVVVSASMIAMLVQHLSLKLGVASGKDLAMAIRDSFHPKVVIFYWLIMEAAIAATDLAEILGAAIALKLLTGLPIAAGVAITGFDVFLILFVQKIRYLEILIFFMSYTILVCLSYIIGLVQPDWAQVFKGVVPSAGVFTNPDELFVAVGILGATVMPHNLFLHSALVQSRDYPRTLVGMKSAVKFATLDMIFALLMAMVVNCFILILAAGTFHYKEGDKEVDSVERAYELLSPAVGAQAASVLFAVALLFSGQQASITGTIAGQVVMEGLLRIKLAPWKRRLATRLVAMTPAIIITTIYGDGAGDLLVMSQVILSIALSFLLIPLIMFTSDPKKMGKDFANSKCLSIFGYILSLVIIALNIYIISSPNTWKIE